MNKTILIPLILLLSISLVSAIGTLTFNDVTVGDNNQERSVTITETFSVTNNGDESVTGIAISTTAGSVYNAVFTNVPTALAVNASATITVSIEIPEDEDAGINDVGDITLTGTAGASSVSETHDLLVEVENNLELNDADIIIDGKKKSLDDGDDFDVAPGDEVEIVIELENTFSGNDYEFDIENIEITIDSDSDLDWEEDYDMDDLRDGKDDSITFTFTVPTDIDEDPFDVEITWEGEDENDAKHQGILEFEINVEKDRDDLRFVDFDFSPSYVDCNDDSIRLSVSFVNIGSDDQDNAVLLIKNTALNYDEILRNINIDEGDEVTKTVVIPLNGKEGAYYLDLELYTSSNDNDLVDVATVILDIDSCGAAPVVEEEDEGIVVEPTTPTLPNVPNFPTTSTGGVTYQTATGASKFLGGNETLYVSLLVVLILLVGALIFVMGIKLGRK